jgi:hypothetical protein
MSKETIWNFVKGMSGSRRLLGFGIIVLVSLGVLGGGE